MSISIKLKIDPIDFALSQAGQANKACLSSEHRPAIRAWLTKPCHQKTTCLQVTYHPVQTAPAFTSLFHPREVTAY